LYGINRSWSILVTVSVFAIKDCGSHRFASVGVVGLKGDVYRMRKRCTPV